MSLFRGSLWHTLGGHGKDQKEEQCDMQANMEESVEDLQVEIKLALWHAFDMLDHAKTGVVQVSQLKVITSTVGMKLGIKKAEELLNQDGVTGMDFQTYFEVVKTKIFSEENRTLLNGSTSPTRSLNDVIKTCYKFCNFERKHKSTSFTSEHCLLLWRLFNFLSETDESGETVCPVQLHPEEASRILKEFIEATGQRNRETLITAFVQHHVDTFLTFTDLLNVFEKDYVVGLSMKDISQGLRGIYDTYILNVLEKGMMWKRGHKHKSWKERWLVLTPTQLRYYVSSNEKIMKGAIFFDKDCSVEVPCDRPTNKPNRFIIHTSKKPYDMSAHDLKTKNEWVSAIQKALDRVGKDPNIQKESTRERCCARKEQRRLATEEERKRREEAELLAKRQLELDEEKRKRMEDEELLKARLGELEEERKKREEAEAMWQEEQRLREAEQQRLRELEEIKRELERLLAEERQAKKDEEIVRTLQAKLLEEEFERREELERLQKQQEEILKAEREQKAVLEEDRQEQERLLSEAKRRLDELEAERVAAEEKMQEASNKLLRAEKDRQIIEEKVKLWKTPVGLARPILPKANPLITHRGMGAFCARDFRKLGTKLEKTNHENADEMKQPENDVTDEISDKSESTTSSKEDKIELDMVPDAVTKQEIVDAKPSQDNNEKDIKINTETLISNKAEWNSSDRDSNSDASAELEKRNHENEDQIKQSEIDVTVEISDKSESTTVSKEDTIQHDTVGDEVTKQESVDEVTKQEIVDVKPSENINEKDIGINTETLIHVSNKAEQNSSGRVSNSDASTETEVEKNHENEEKNTHSEIDATVKISDKSESTIISKEDTIQHDTVGDEVTKQETIDVKPSEDNNEKDIETNTETLKSNNTKRNSSDGDSNSDVATENDVKNDT